MPSPKNICNLMFALALTISSGFVGLFFSYRTEQNLGNYKELKKLKPFAMSAIISRRSQNIKPLFTFDRCRNHKSSSFENDWSGLLMVPRWHYSEGIQKKVQTFVWVSDWWPESPKIITFFLIRIQLKIRSEVVCLAVLNDYILLIGYAVFFKVQAIFWIFK